MYLKARGEFEKFLSKGPISEAVVKNKRSNLERLRAGVDSAKSKLEKRQTKYPDSANVSMLYRTIIGNSFMKIPGLEIELPPQFSSFKLDNRLALLDKEVREIVSSILIL